ncbi:MAG: hypothetical protein NW226_05080 [Microscillaceae bacterium]|nr:hypothetical protein [Microscillaceae bacterium]
MRYASFFLLVLGLISCASSDEDNPTTGIIRYSLDGNQVTSRSSGVINLYIDEDDSTVVDIFESNFGDTDAEMIFTVGSLNNLVGTYPITPDNWLLLFDGTGQSFIFYESSNCATPTGQITITEHDPEQRTFSGTFEGQICTTGGQSRTLSGSFLEVRYIIQIQVDSE